MLRVKGWKTACLVLGLLLGLAACQKPQTPAAPNPTATQPVPATQLAQPTQTSASPPVVPAVTGADWPTAGWQTAPPETQGMSSDLTAYAPQKVQEGFPYITSLVIVRHGYIVYEGYFNGATVSSLHNLHSATKSVTSAAFGALGAEGRLPDLDARLPDLLPEYFTAGAHADKRDIRLRDLLMMRSGIAFNEWDLSTRWYADPDATLRDLLGQDLAAAALDYPQAARPGEVWNYSTADAQLAAAVFQHAAGEPLADYANRRLFTPLGITNYQWPQDAAGVTLGGTFLQLTARDMAKIGYLYLNRGQWDGQSIVPPDWVDLTTAPQGPGIDASSGQTLPIDWYGYYWWRWNPGWEGVQGVLRAEGYGPQIIDIYPDLDMVAVITTDLHVAPQEFQDRRWQLNDLLGSLVYRALRD